MPLTPENRVLSEEMSRINDVWGSIDHDVSLMDEEQLERFIRLSFVGDHDIRLVASFVWSYTGARGDQSQTSAFASYIAHLRRKAVEPRTDSPDAQRLEVDPQIKDRIDKVMEKLVSECLKQKGKPTQEHLAFTQGLLEIAYDIRWYGGGKNSLEMQFSKGFEQAAEGSSDKSLSIGKVIAIGRQMKSADLNDPILDLVTKIKADERYAKSLKFPPFV